MAITKFRYEPGNEVAWLELRNSMKDRVGGSMLGAINNNSNYSDFPKELSFEVGLEKRPDISHKIAVMRGHYDEEFVATLFEMYSGLKVHKENCIIVNDKYPHLKSSIDRKIANCRAGLECKTASFFVMKKFKSDEFPMAYWDQCVSYLATTELDDWYLAILTGENEFKCFRLTRKKEVADRFIELRKKFCLEVDENDTDAEEWNRDFAWLDAVYYVDDEEIAGCEARAAYFIGKVEAVNGYMKQFDAEHPDASGVERMAHLSHCVEQVLEPHDFKDYDATNSKDKEKLQDLINDLHPITVVDKEVRLDPNTPNALEIRELLKEREELANACKAFLANEDQKARANRIAEIDIKLATKMGDAEKVTLPTEGGKTWELKFETSEGRRTVKLADVEKYFAAQGIDVPDGIISVGESKRSFKVSEMKPKAAKRTSVPKKAKAA